jgi:hypothetical protein
MLKGLGEEVAVQDNFLTATFQMLSGRFGIKAKNCKKGDEV